jgi:Ca2+:H+ antiporter
MRLEYVWYVLGAAVPLAFILWLAHASPVWLFLAAGLGIIPLAALMGHATEALAEHLGPRAGGLLNATFGNAAELILALVALHRGLPMIVKASLIGSILGNTLLVLGLSLLVGGLRYRRQQFDRTMAGLQSVSLVLAAIGLAVPSVLFHLLPPRAEVALSIEVSLVLLVTYALSLVFALVQGDTANPALGRAHVPPASASPQGGAAAGARPWGPTRASAYLLLATVLVAGMSDLLVHAITEARDEGYLTSLGMTELFIGVVVVAVIGNAAEHSTAVMMAYRNQVDLSLEIAIGSSLQIALLVAPLLVLASLVIAPQPLDLHFTMLEVLAVTASVVVVALVAADGESHWMEGVLLLAVYLILAMAFYHLPAEIAAPLPHPA